MSNKTSPTKRQRDERARRIAMGIAVIQKPLRHILNRAGGTAENPSFTGKQARIYANRGEGGFVKNMARQFL